MTHKLFPDDLTQVDSFLEPWLDFLKGIADLGELCCIKGHLVGFVAQMVPDPVNGGIYRFPTFGNDLENFIPLGQPVHGPGKQPHHFLGKGHFGLGHHRGIDLVQFGFNGQDVFTYRRTIVCGYIFEHRSHFTVVERYLCLGLFHDFPAQGKDKISQLPVRWL